MKGKEVDLVEALFSAFIADGEWRTIGEWAEAAGVSRNRVDRFLLRQSPDVARRDDKRPVRGSVSEFDRKVPTYAPSHEHLRQVIRGQERGLTAL